MTKAEAGGTPGAPEAGRGRPDPPLEPPEGGGPGTPGSRLGRTPFCGWSCPVTGVWCGRLRGPTEISILVFYSL